MKNFFETVKNVGDLHHAYFFVGDAVEVKEELLEFFDTKLKIKVQGNPDFKILNFENLTVDHARLIRESSEKMNFGEKMMFLISFESASIEAQNSLLKTLEEPSQNTHFFFISPQDNLLPTLKSRMVIIKSQNSNPKSQNEESILNLSFKERLDKVKEITEAISDEDATKQDAIDFLNSIETELAQDSVEKNSKALKVCQNTREYLLDRGAPVKIILENLVLSI